MTQPAAHELERRIRALELENAALKAQQAHLQDRIDELMAIVGSTPAPIYLKDAAFRYILVNPFFEGLSRSKLDQLRGKTDYDLFPAAVAALFRQQDEEVVRHRAPREFEETIPLPDGEFSFITVKFPVLDGQGRVRAVGGFCTDITARKRSELEREVLIEQLQQALREVAALRKIIPICSYCKQIRDDQGFWSQIEAYLAEHAELEFSHGICPACAERVFGKAMTEGG